MNLEVTAQNIANNPDDYSAEKIQQLFEQYGQQCIDSEVTFRTSQQWWEELYYAKGLVVYDPDGWDRKNYQYSWHEEPISEKEFNRRVGQSTCLWSKPDKDE